MPGLLRDVRHALRRLLKSPGFAFSAGLTLALGIGATTLVYSVVQAVLLNSLPFPDAKRLVVLAESQNGQDFSVAWPNFEDWRAQAHSFAGMAGYELEHFQYFDGSHTILPRGMRVSAAFFPVLRAQPVAGRVFTPAEDHPGGTPVVVLSYHFWQNELHGNPSVVGSTLDLSDQAYTVVGIMPVGFQYFYGHPEDFYVARTEGVRAGLQQPHGTWKHSRIGAAGSGGKRNGCADRDGRHCGTPGRAVSGYESRPLGDAESAD